MDVFNFEFYKIVKSNRFKIVILLFIVVSTINICSERISFKDYGKLNKVYYKSYYNNIKDIKNELIEIEKDTYIKTKYYQTYEQDKAFNKYHLEFYKNHKPVKLKKDFSQGLARTIYMHDYLYIILLICCDVIGQDKKKNITSIQCATKTSRSKMYFCKFISLVSAVTIVYIINFVWTFLLSGLLLGFSSLTSPIQTIRGLDFSILNINARQYVILRTIIGWVALVFGCLIYMFISTIFENPLICYVIGVLTVTFDNVFYYMFNPSVLSIYIKYFVISVYFFLRYNQFCKGFYINLYNLKGLFLALTIQFIFIYWLGFKIYKKKSSY
ncbi:hypothetical protein [Clostridium oceanicum]|uniref:ABC-2 family transporter protein n=1 Tax=Clostridium oceanicum TaxID=1543 RepID=A0ABN1JIZ5_9CLOT